LNSLKKEPEADNIEYSKMQHSIILLFSLQFEICSHIELTNLDSFLNFKKNVVSLKLKNLIIKNEDFNNRILRFHR